MSYAVKTKDGNPVQINGEQLLGSDHINIEIKDFSDKERSFLAVASVESPDRMGDVISVKGWELDNYLKNPVVMPFHNYSILPVGRSLEIFPKGKKLMFVPQFAPYPEASRMYEMYRDKYLKGFSVGFIPKESKKIETEEEDRPLFWHQPTKYLKQELLEMSVAPIPAHQDALSELKTMVKKGDIYVPPKYLVDKNEPYIENYDEYIHVIVESEDKFKRLYIIPLHTTKDGVTEEVWAWVVYGPCKDSDHNLYFNQRFIFSKDAKDEKTLLEWVAENDKQVDINTDSKDSPIILSLFDKNTEIKLEPFDPRKYEAKSPVLVELPQLEKEIDADSEEETIVAATEEETPETERITRFNEALDKLKEMELTDEENAKLAKELSELTKDQLVERLEKSFQNALKVSFDLLLEAFKGMLEEHKTESIEEEVIEEEIIEEEVDIDSIENNPNPSKDIIELEDETQTPGGEDIDIDVNEFKKMVKSTVNACLGRLDD